MSNHRIVFTAVTTTELKFVDSTIATDGGLTVVLQNGERAFAIPTANVVAIERLPKMAPAPPPEDQPVPADVQTD